METGITEEERREEDEDEVEGVEADYDGILHAGVRWVWLTGRGHVIM